MKKLLIIVLLFTCCACSNTPVESVNNPLILKENEGSVEALNFNEMIEKIENKESFVVILSGTYCYACLDFFMQSDEYTKEIGLTLWDVVLDDEPTSEAENLVIANEYLGFFSTTPSIYYIENGEVKDALYSNEVEVSLENYKSFLIRNNIISE